MDRSVIGISQNLCNPITEMQRMGEIAQIRGMLMNNHLQQSQLSNSPNFQDNMGLLSNVVQT